MQITNNLSVEIIQGIALGIGWTAYGRRLKKIEVVIGCISIEYKLK